MKALASIICALLLPAGFSAAAEAYWVVPFEEFAAWPAAKQQAYERELRSIFYEFEKGSQDKMEFAGVSPETKFWLDILPKAFAASDRACLVGGIRRAMVPSGDRYVCPTGGRKCAPHGEAGFQCGTIYNDKCITRQPVDTITDRCNLAAGTGPVDEAAYNAKREAIQSVAADCRSGGIDDRYKSQCQQFLLRLDRINSTPNEVPASLQTDTDTSATAVVPLVAPRRAIPEADTEVAAESPAALPERVPLPVKKPRGPPKATRNEPAAKGDCMTRNQAQLGALACVACGMENAAEAEIRNNGKGVSKWVALLGVMAQSSYGPFNVKDPASRRAYQQRVAEMVASYGYCTNREYPITPGNETRDLIDGRALTPARQKQFAHNFGLMSTVRGFFSGRVENANDPMRYANKIFADNHPRHGWNSGNVQNRQWRFRSMIKAYRQSYNSPFAQCAHAVEGRLANSKHFRMCPIRETFVNRHLKIVRPSAVTGREMANNQAFYESMISECSRVEKAALPKKRRMPNNSCDHGCWGNRGTFPHATSHIPYCGSDGRNADRPPGEGGGNDRENSRDRDSNERGEDSSNRGDYGGGRDGGGNGDGGSDPGGGGNPGGGGKEGGEASSTR